MVSFVDDALEFVLAVIKKQNGAILALLIYPFIRCVFGSVSHESQNKKQENMNHKPVLLNRSLSEWLSSLPVFLLLILTLVIGTGEMIHGQLLRMGEKLFGDPATGVQYFMLRADPAKPVYEVSDSLSNLVFRCSPVNYSTIKTRDLYKP